MYVAMYNVAVVVNLIRFIKKRIIFYFIVERKPPDSLVVLLSFSVEFLIMKSSFVIVLLSKAKARGFIGDQRENTSLLVDYFLIRYNRE